MKTAGSFFEGFWKIWNWRFSGPKWWDDVDHVEFSQDVHQLLVWLWNPICQATLGQIHGEEGEQHMNRHPDNMVGVG